MVRWVGNRKRARRRGAALVMVLIFSVAAMALILTMLTLSNAGASVESARHRDKSLVSIARYGLATSVAEVNRKRNDATFADPTDHGFGCVLVDEDDGRRGKAVRDRSGRLLGRFTTKVTTSGSQKILEVVVVEGEFPADWTAAQKQLAAGTLRYVTMEMAIDTANLPFDRNALSIRGPAGAGGRNGFYASPSANQVKIHGDGVPAVNISDKEMYDKFIENSAIDGWGEFDGLDPVSGENTADMPTGGGVTENDLRRLTVTNEEVGLLSQDTLEKVALGVNDRVAQVIATGTAISDTDTTLPEGDYYVNSTLDIESGETLKGSGTLVINAGLEVKGTLDWDGEIIIANNDAASVDVKGDVTVRNGVLAIQGYGTATNMNVTIRSGAKVNIGTESASAFTILGDANTQNPLRFDNGAQGAFVNGVFTIMGDALRMDFDTGSKVFVNGSLALVSPDGTSTGLDVKFRNGAHCELNFVANNFDGAVDRLGEFFDPTKSFLPIEMQSYVEDPARRDDLLKAHIETDTGAGNDYGMP